MSNLKYYDGTALRDMVTDPNSSDYIRQPTFIATSGSVNAYLIYTSPAPTAYIDGMGAYLDIHVANTGASTLNWNELGAKPIVDGKGNALSAGKLPLNGIVGVRYNASTGNFQLLGERGEYGTVTADKVLAGTTFGMEDGLHDGAMIDRKATEVTARAVDTATSTKLRFYLPNENANYNGNSVVSLSDPDFIAANILGSKNVFGLQGGISEYPYGQLASETWTNGSGELYLKIPKGAYLTEGGWGAGYSAVRFNEPNFKAENIPYGITMFGVVGTRGAPLIFDQAFLNSGTFTPTPGTITVITTNTMNSSAGLSITGRSNNPSGGSGTPAGYLRWTKDIDLTNYSTLTFYAKKGTDHGNLMVFVKEVGDTSNTHLASTYLTYGSFPTTWTQYSISVSAITGVKTVWFAGGYSDNSGNTTSNTQYCDIKLLA